MSPAKTKAVPTPDDLPAPGNCYQDHFELIADAEKPWRLVHGRPTLTVPPYCQFGHAWLELDDTVFDITNGYSGPRDVYYALGKIDLANNKYYTKGRAINLARKHMHYGPWEGPDSGAKKK